MKLIVGLGNPGKEYGKTRHNVGFMVVDKTAEQVGVTNWEFSKRHQSFIINYKSVIFAKPQTFMNESGKAVNSLVTFYKLPPPDIYVVHDDLDIRLGEFKLQKGVGPKLHYGIQSINMLLGSEDYWRLRIGVDAREAENRVSGEAYVLQQFGETENEVLDKVLKEAASNLLSILKFT